MPLFMISDDANGLRARELSHAVEHAHADGDFGSLRVDVPRTQAGAGERLEPIHGVLGKRTTVIAADLLPFSVAEVSDRSDCLIAPRGPRHARRPVSGAVARRDARYRTACRNRGMTRLGVVSSIAANGIKPLVGRNLVEQFGQDVAIGNVLMRQQHGTYLTGGRVECEMYLAPRETIRIAMLAHLPFAFTADLHARAVDHQMNRFAVTHARQLNFQRLRATTERRVVRNGQGSESRIVQALREALQGTQRQAEHGLQAKQRLNQCIAIQMWTTACRLGVGHARKDGFVAPHRDVT